MPNRILAIAAIGLAVGLSACDKGGQEQAQQPDRQQQQGAKPTPGPQQGMTPQSESTAPPPASSQEKP